MQGATSPFVPFDASWDRPQLTDEDLRAGHAFEWWYFDLASEDGVELVVLFSRRNSVFASGKCSVFVQYDDGSTSFNHVRNWPAEQFRWTEVDGGHEITIADNTLAILGESDGEPTYRMRVDLPWIELDLDFRPEHRGFLPTEDGCYFRNRRDPFLRTCVSFSAPLMTASGTIGLNGLGREVRGRGYHDHPWGTEMILWTHREWNWARTASGGAGVMFAKVRPADEYEGRLDFLYQGVAGTFDPRLHDGVDLQPSQWGRDHWYGIRFPHALGVAAGGSSWSARCLASLLDAPVYNRSTIDWRAEREPKASHGWLEYYSMVPWMRWFAYFALKIFSFFTRSFPFFGR